MNIRKYRWSKVYESAEEELVDFLAAKHVDAERHEIDSYETHELPILKDTHIWSVEGAAFFTVNDKKFSLQPGDVLDIPSRSSCTVVTSLSSFAWFESHD